MSKNPRYKVNIENRTGSAPDFSPQALERWNDSLTPKALSEDETAINIFGPIGTNWYDYDPVTVKNVAQRLREIGDSKVTVYINSPGGDMFEGIGIYNLLVDHKGEVEVKIMGLAASAASIIAMAGDTVKMGRASNIMIHNSRVLAYGDQHQFREVADFLAPFDIGLSEIYAHRTGLESSLLKSMLDKETFLSASEAIEKSFADALLDETADVSFDHAENQNSNQIKNAIQAALSRSGYSRSQARALFNKMNEDKPRAIQEGTQSAALADMHHAVANWLKILEKI